VAIGNVGAIAGVATRIAPSVDAIKTRVKLDAIFTRRKSNQHVLQNPPHQSVSNCDELALSCYFATLYSQEIAVGLGRFS